MSTTKRSTATDAKGNQKPARSSADQIPSGGEENVQSLEKVRDILFGANMRTYEERLALLEQRLLEELGEIRKVTDASVERLETSVRKELAQLGDKLKAETDARSTTVASVTTNFEQTAESLKSKIEDVDGRLKESGAGLADRISDETKTITSRLEQTAHDLTERLDRELADVRAAKPDTASLAALFAELAERLREESPGHAD